MSADAEVQLTPYLLVPQKAGRVDTAALDLLVRRLLPEGVAAVGILGPSGQYAHLDRAARMTVLHTCVQAAGRRPVICGVEADDVADALRRIEELERCGAAQALITPAPSIVACQRSAQDFYEGVARGSTLPFWIYSNAKATGIEFSETTLVALASVPGVRGIKIGLHTTAPASIALITSLIAALPASVALAAGDGVPVHAAIQAGVRHWHSFLAGVFPRQAAEWLRKGASHRTEDMDDGEGFEALARALRERNGARANLAAILEQKGLVNAPCLPAPTSLPSSRAALHDAS